MNSRGNQGSDVWKTDYMRNLYRRHVQGALVRSGASLIMWLFALGSFWAGAIQINHFRGISASVAYLILINPPTLWILKRTTQINSFKYISLLITILEIIGYTAIIYFLGGIQSAYLIALYCALITYVGIVGTRRLPFVVASFCSICFSLIVVLEQFGFLPSQHLISHYYCPWETQLAILSAAIGLLFVTAFIASHTANLLKRNREKLRQQNADLVFTNERLQKEIAERERVENEYLDSSKKAEKKLIELAAAEATAAAEKKKAEELEALNQQLRASEQQLRTSEQQLKAANQKLEAKEQALQESQTQLMEKLAQVERFNKAMVGRELTMIKLKEEINSLLEEMGKPKKY